jgi:hypothetical protein
MFKPSVDCGLVITMDTQALQLSEFDLDLKKQGCYLELDCLRRSE